MQLELSDEDAAALRELLDASVVQLRGEIHDTDNVAFRRGLTSTRETLESIRARLGG